MTINANTLPAVPTPSIIGDTLFGIAEALRDLRATEPPSDPTALAERRAEEADMLRRAIIDLRAAATNVRLLFELKADDKGEFMLENYGQAWMLADLLRKGNMVPSSYETPEQVVIGLMKSMEIGVAPISGLGNIMIINNRPSVWGDLAQALVQRTGAIADHFKEEIGIRPTPGLELSEWDDSYGWRVGFMRTGQATPYVQTYTVADAKRAGMWLNAKKKPWISDPTIMLFNRARARALRDGFSDKLFGMGIIEEQRDFETERNAMLSEPPKALTSSLLDDEPEGDDDAPAMPNYAEQAAQGGAQQDGGDQPSLLP